MTLLAILPAIHAAELAGWSAREPLKGNGITLTRAPGSDWQPVPSATLPAVKLTPVNDYFKRASFVFRLDRSIPASTWLTVGFLDRGYGVISPALGTDGRGVSQRNSRGAIILNSGKLRHASFHLEKGVESIITLTGLQFLHSISITDTEPPAEPLPPVNTAFTLKRPMDLVITAGADAPSIDGLPDSIAYLRNQLPLMKALGFNGIESYVKWNFVERSPGVFDWSYYDAIVAEVEKHGMKWFPLLIVGSAYALPDWFYDSPDNHPFVCLEHNQAIEIPTIFGGAQEKYVRRFLNEFGKHYGSNPSLLGIRLGPSGNYGEAQYPATGAWGYKGRPLHTHIGYWAGDPHAIADFRQWLTLRYPSIESLNKAWAAKYSSFDEVRTFLPVTANTPRMRLDFSTWYIDAMSDWCDRWAVWAREAMPHTSIYQSSGGWGAIEIGTDYAAHSRSMARLNGGIRMTNENDSYLNNFGNTRLAASAARFYGAKWGSEPAGFSSMRGVVNRIYNALTNDAEHLFYYEGNLTSNDQAIGAWLKFAPLLDGRSKPRAPIAVFYNDTANKLRDDTLRYLRASAYLQRVHTLRSVTDFDLVSEQMIFDGALDRYQALVMIWGNTTRKEVLDRVATWVDRGGAIFYPDRELTREGPLQSIEGDSTAFKRWQAGNTGKGKAFLFSGQTEPFSAFAAYVRRELSKLDSLDPSLRSAMSIRKPEDTFWTVMDDGRLAILNYGDAPAAITLPGGQPLNLAPYAIWVSPPSARKAALAQAPLKISVYATAGGILRHLSTQEQRERAVAAMRNLGVSRVILEGRRGDEYVPPETLADLRRHFAALGFETSGGIATVPGKNFGVRQQGALSWLNWEAPATRKGIEEFFRTNAAVFDELVVDDFYCTMDTSAQSEAARKGRDWGEYRRDLLTGLIQPMMITPARRSNYGVSMVIKYPQWYDRFHLFGYDPARMSSHFDRVWVGTEVRNPKTQRMGFVQPIQGYINYRWLRSVIGDRVEAAWFDHIECTGQNFVDQAWQSVLAGARELVLFNLIDVIQGHPGHALFQKALPELRAASLRVRAQQPDGVPFYKPPDSEPGDNRFLMDYLAMLGIPIDPVSEYPSKSRAVILGMQAAHDPALLQKVKSHLASGARVAMTASLLDKLQPPPELKGIIRLDLRTFSEQDYRDVGEWLLPPKELSWLDMSREEADALRKSLGAELSAPPRIAYYRFGPDEALYSFLDSDTSVTLRGKPVTVPAHSLVWVNQPNTKAR